MPRGQTETVDCPLAPDVPLGLRARIGALRRLHSGLAEIRAAGGPVTMVRAGPRRLIPPFAVVTSPQGAHDVLGATDGAFDKETVFFVEGRRWLGDNLFSVAHEQWLPRRRAYQPLFTKRRVAGYATSMAGIGADFASEWAGSGTIDLAVETRRLTLRVLGSSLFGTDLDDRAPELAHSIAASGGFVLDRGLRPARAPHWLPTPARRRFHAAKSISDAVIDDAIAAAHADPDSAPLLQLFFGIEHPHTGKPLPDSVIRDELRVFLTAGHDTTATTLAYALWALGRDRALQDRAAEEATALGPHRLRVEDVGRLEFTTHVIQEALRVCPPAPALARQAMRDVVVDGFRIPAGTNVIVGIYVIHHDPDLWDNADRFDPERFATHCSTGFNRWQYLPFGGGPRTCIGDHFAILEATLALAGILRSASIDALEPHFPVTTPLTLIADGPIPARVSPRTRVAA
ncbi:cytochrome P450 [Nocardia sp. NPDC058379]|uniref:cytochrome P450 n=1 Tax=unclassified Nocardia TaxID=2637762 RepID=UPI00364A39AF